MLSTGVAGACAHKTTSTLEQTTIVRILRTSTILADPSVRAKLRAECIRLGGPEDVVDNKNNSEDSEDSDNSNDSNDSNNSK